MTHPLENYRVIANSSYITDIEDKLYLFRFLELKNIADAVEREKDKDRLKITFVSDVWGEGHIVYETVTSYFISEYNKLEREARTCIDSFILTILEKPKQQLFIENTIAILQELQNTIDRNTIEEKYEPYKAILSDKIASFSKSLEDIYLKGNKQLISSTSNQSFRKLKWLGNTNILTTLFYDLINGVKSANIPKLIDAKAPEIETFIINNFVDKDGKDFDFKSTINTNLKHSKQSTKRALDGDSIDLNYYYKPE